MRGWCEVRGCEERGVRGVRGCEGRWCEVRGCEGCEGVV